MILTVFRGTREIGGSCVQVRTNSTRVVLDFGLPLLTPEGNPFDTQAAVRKTTRVLWEEGTIPHVPGLVWRDGPSPDAILLTHAHLDHSGLIHRSRPEIPVYTTTGTSKMMLAGAVFGGQARLPRKRQRPITPGHAFAIGDITVTPFSVDHSTFGSVAFLLESKGKAILYTGDLRDHGRKPGMLRTLVTTVTPKAIDVLLVEGTHLGDRGEQGVSEFELEERVLDLVRSAAGLVLAAFSPQDVDHLVTLYRAARRSGRVFVVDAYGAFILQLVSGEAHVPRPIAEKGIRVYFNRAFLRKGPDHLKDLFSPARIHLENVLSDPNRYLMAFRPSMTAPDFGGRLPHQVRLLYGYWPGYLRNPEWVELRDQVGAAGGDFIPAHASGHITSADLIAFVHAVNPVNVIPIHTLGAEKFHDHFPNTVRLRDGDDYALR